ncbi:hypothetical protein [Nitratireductor luteus]|uniref:hypothetical protein n=1 Tax=Nitratireductor luteus TaxID=2976980 RepID=UPI00223FE32F|nr:hypothetical protein [Nitratireductor luteus]
MSRNRLIPLAALIGLAASLSGCADYLNHYDTVTLAAGDVQKYNMMLQTTNAFNPASEVTEIPSDGKRAADAVERYRKSQEPGQAQPPANITFNIGQ